MIFQLTQIYRLEQKKFKPFLINFLKIFDIGLLFE